MKKTIALLFALSSTFGFGNAHAAKLDVATGITTALCDVLNEDVKPALSKNVTLHYSCNRDQNVVKVASCHQFGSRKIETVACAVTGSDPVTGDPTYNNASCTGVGSEHTFQTGNFGKAFTGASSGGSVAAASMTAICDDAGTALTGFVE